MKQLYKNIFHYPPDYPVCKEFQDFLFEVIAELKIPFIYVHSDKMAHSKFCEILWKNKDMYTKVILLIVGIKSLNQLRVVQQPLYNVTFSRKTENGASMLKQ